MCSIHEIILPYVHAIRIASFIVCVVVAGMLLSFQYVHAQSAPGSADVEMLQDELKSIEKQITTYEKTLSVTKKQRAQIAYLLGKLKAQRLVLQDRIRSSGISRNALRARIDQVLVRIDEQISHISSIRNELMALVRTLAISTNRTPFESFIVHRTLSSYLDEQMRMISVIRLIHLDHLTLKANISKLEEKKKELESEVEELEHALAQQNVQQQQLTDNAKLQTQLLSKAQQKEKTTAQQLIESREKAKKIRTRIYELFNVGKQISFGTAYEIAKWASQQYHVRPAFLLAVLTQESNLGRNVGTCNRATDPTQKHWRSIMKPTRDHAPFLTITKELGLDPDTTPVSCPMMRNGKQIGWGGAMGPAQFIPSTWMGYRDKVRAVTGKTANPWDIRDAFLAAAIKLSHDGASSSEKSEFNAALRYFSGSVNLTYRFYGDNVLSIARKYEEDIEQLEAFR